MERSAKVEMFLSKRKPSVISQTVVHGSRYAKQAQDGQFGRYTDSAGPASSSAEKELC